MNAPSKRALAARRAALCLSTILATGLALPAFAQSAAAPELRRNNDEHGVDLTTGTYNLALVEGDIGNAGEGIKLVRYWGQAGFKDNWSGDLRVTGTAGSQVATITFGNISAKFTQSGSSWTNTKADGATLTSSADANGMNLYTFKAANGTSIAYSSISSLLTAQLGGTHRSQ